MPYEPTEWIDKTATTPGTKINRQRMMKIEGALAEVFSIAEAGNVDPSVIEQAIQDYLAANPPAAVADASATVKGIVELATNAETTTGTDTVRAVTPAGVKAVVDGLSIPPAPASASTTVAGLVELATSTETLTGTDTARAVTPAGVKAVVDSLPAPGMTLAVYPDEAAVLAALAADEVAVGDIVAIEDPA